MIFKLVATVTSFSSPQTTQKHILINYKKSSTFSHFNWFKKVWFFILHNGKSPIFPERLLSMIWRISMQTKWCQFVEHELCDRSQLVLRDFMRIFVFKVLIVTLRNVKVEIPKFVAVLKISRWQVLSCVQNSQVLVPLRNSYFIK